MKQCIYLLIIMLVASSCTSIQKEIRKGDYDSAFDKALRKVINREGNEKYALLLENAADKAYNRDIKKIEYLKQEGNPANLDEIYYFMEDIHCRYQAVAPVLPLHLASKNRDAVFKDISSEDLIAAKTKAAEYLYAHALKKLESKNRFDAREAYDELLIVNEFFKGFRDVDAQIKNAWQSGLSRVLLSVVNTSNTVMPASLEKQITSLDLEGLNSLWVKFETIAQPGVDYAYKVIVKMVKIDAGPEQVLKNKTTETKTIEDGWQYVLDSHGNVMKDSLGNDIKTKKYKTISCDLIETLQKKDALVSATVNFYSSQNELIYSFPVSGMQHWQYVSAVAVGDLNALNDASRAKLNHVVPAPFISDEEILLSAGENLKPWIKSTIENNRYRLK